MLKVTFMSSITTSAERNLEILTLLAFVKCLSSSAFYLQKASKHTCVMLIFMDILTVVMSCHKYYVSIQCWWLIYFMDKHCVWTPFLSFDKHNRKIWLRNNLVLTSIYAFLQNKICAGWVVPAYSSFTFLRIFSKNWRMICFNEHYSGSIRDWVLCMCKVCLLDSWIFFFSNSY